MPPSAKPLIGTDAARAAESPREDILGSVLTEAALSELKRQAPDGCVLCSLDTWDQEEWD